MLSLILLAAVAPHRLWTIEGPFALTPGGWGAYREDGFYVVGRSVAAKDWPYVHPGPSDGWAGSRPHPFRIAFALTSAPRDGNCELAVRVTDTHDTAPPLLRLTVNGKTVSSKALPRGTGGGVFGDDRPGRSTTVRVTFSARDLRRGLNTVALVSERGSWMTYGAVTLDGPESAKPGPAPDTVASFDGVASPALRKTGERAAQAAELRVLRFTDGGKGLVLLDGKPAGEYPLRRGSNRIPVPLPAVPAPTRRTIELRVAGQTFAKDTFMQKPNRNWVIYILPHSHVDIGYTQLQSAVEQRQMDNLDEAMRICEKTRSYPEDARFKWNAEVLWPVDGYLRSRPADRQATLLAAIRRGDVGLQALYGNELTGLCRPEEMFRLCDMAVRLRTERGLPVDSAMISDVPGWSWGIVPALAQSGMRYLSAGPNLTDRIGGTLARWGDRPFWWVGPSGKDRVLCWVAGGGYSSFHGQTLSQAGEAWIAGYLRRLEADGYPYDMVQVRYTTGGDNGPPDGTVCDFVKSWNATHASPRLVIATSSRMFADFEKAYGKQLPVAKGDFTPYWEDGAASSALETAETRAAADSLVQSETLWAMRGGSALPSNDDDRAWRNALLYDEHTWGAFNSVSEPDSPFVKDQWKVKKAFADDAAALARSLREAVAPAAGQSRTVAVVNTHSWSCGGLVALDCTAGNRVQDDDGKPLPSQRLGDGRLAVWLPPISPFATRRLRVDDGDSPQFKGVSADGVTLTGDDLTVKVDPKTGAIVSLHSKAPGIDLADPKIGINGYFYLPGSDLSGLETSGRVSVAVKESGPLVASLLITSDAPGCRNLTREVRLVHGSDAVEIVDTIDKLPVRQKEGVHLAFGFNVPDPVTRIEVPWGVVRPGIDQLPGSCMNWYSTQRWLDVSNDRYGVTVATPDVPLWEVGGITANLLGSQTDPGAWMQEQGSSAKLYAWVMNNHWHTNYRAEQEGPTVFRFALRPHGPFQASEAVRFGIERAEPPVVVSTSVAFAMPIVSMGKGSVSVASMKPSRDGRATMIRLFNASDRAATCRPVWRKGVKAFRSSPAEETGRACGKELRLPPWGVVTVRAE